MSSIELGLFIVKPDYDKIKKKKGKNKNKKNKKRRERTRGQRVKFPRRCNDQRLNMHTYSLSTTFEI